MRIPTSLRVALLSALLVLASNLALLAFIHLRTHDDAITALRQTVHEESSALEDVYNSGGRPALDEAVADSLDSDDPQLLAGVIDARGRRVTGNVLALAGPATLLRPGYREGFLKVQDEDQPLEAGYSLTPLKDGAWLLSGRSFGERIALQRTLERSLFLAGAISVILGIFGGLITARYVAQRVRGITAVAQRISEGDMTQRVPIAGERDAFDRLAAQINRMLDRIGVLMEELRLLTDSLAHDLRSPVGRLRARIEAALHATEEEKRDALLSGVLAEADALMRILTTVLEIGRSEAKTSRNQFAWLEPRELVGELADMYEPLAEESGVQLKVVEQGVLLPLLGHRQLLAQALSNLIDNAVKYGSGGGEIILFVEQDDEHLRLGVSDRGPGIDPEEEPEARRRFGRLDSSRTSAGAGLGLPLAEAVAHLHGGELELGRTESGFKAELVLPGRSSS